MSYEDLEHVRLERYAKDAEKEDAKEAKKAKSAKPVLSAEKSLLYRWRGGVVNRYRKLSDQIGHLFRRSWVRFLQPPL